MLIEMSGSTDEWDMAAVRKGVTKYRPEKESEVRRSVAIILLLKYAPVVYTTGSQPLHEPSARDAALPAHRYDSDGSTQHRVDAAHLSTVLAVMAVIAASYNEPTMQACHNSR